MVMGWSADQHVPSVSETKKGIPPRKIIRPAKEQYRHMWPNTGPSPFVFLKKIKTRPTSPYVPAARVSLSDSMNSFPRKSLGEADGRDAFALLCDCAETDAWPGGRTDGWMGRRAICCSGIAAITPTCLPTCRLRAYLTTLQPTTNLSIACLIVVAYTHSNSQGNNTYTHRERKICT